MGNIVRVEKLLSDTFCKIETVKNQRPIWFGYGDSVELDKILLLKGEKGKYPLLWYVMPNKLKYSQGYAKGKFTFILAHNTTSDWNNDQRFQKTFDTILFPYLENMLKAIERSHNVTLSMQTGYQFTNFPNYGGAKSEQIDFWDAIKIEIDDLQIFEDNEC